MEVEQSRRSGHRRGDRHDPFVSTGQRDQRVGEGLGERLRGYLFVVVSRRQLVVVHLQVVVNRGLVAETFRRQDVDEDRSVPLRGALQGVFHRLDVVSVDGTDVAHAEVLEESVRGHHFAHHRRQSVDTEVGRLADFRKMRNGSAQSPAHREVRLVEA